MYDQKYGRKLVKPLKIEKNKGKREAKARECSETERIYFIDPDDQDYKETPKKAWRKLERPVAAVMWTKFGKAAQNREKQEWKPKLDNAQRLRGISFIDTDDEEYKEIFNAMRKVQRPMAPAMPSKRSPKGITKVFTKQEMASQKGPKNDLWL